MPIPFRPVTAADADLLRSYTMESKCMNCDMNVTNLCGWQFLYHTEWALVEGFLVLRFVSGGQVTYMKPIGKGDLRRVLELLMADARSLGDTLRMACVCPCAQGLMEESMPGAFTYTTDRDRADYLYLRERLVTLAGKKLQPKRNHISKFKRLYPDYAYRPLTSDLVPDCLRLGEEWCRTNDCHMQRAMQANQHQCDYVMEVSPANLQKLTCNTSSEQVSLTIADYAYTGRVLEKVQSMGYIAASVFQLGSTKIIDEKALERSQTLKICMMALIAIMLLQVILLRAMFANQTGDYKLLSNIGLTCSTAMRSICVQLVILAFAGQLLAGGAIWFCALQNVTRIVNVLVYLPIGYIALLLGIHDLVSVIGITWVLLSLKKQVYPLAGKETDLEMEETEVRVV